MIKMIKYIFLIASIMASMCFIIMFYSVKDFLKKDNDIINNILIGIWKILAIVSTCNYIYHAIEYNGVLPEGDFLLQFTIFTLFLVVLAVTTRRRNKKRLEYEKYTYEKEIDYDNKMFAKAIITKRKYVDTYKGIFFIIPADLCADMDENGKIYSNNTYSVSCDYKSLTNQLMNDNYTVVRFTTNPSCCREKSVYDIKNELAEIILEIAKNNEKIILLGSFIYSKLLLEIEELVHPSAIFICQETLLTGEDIMVPRFEGCDFDIRSEYKEVATYMENQENVCWNLSSKSEEYWIDKVRNAKSKILLLDFEYDFYERNFEGITTIKIPNTDFTWHVCNHDNWTVVTHDGYAKKYQGFITYSTEFGKRVLDALNRYTC